MKQSVDNKPLTEQIDEATHRVQLVLNDIAAGNVAAGQLKTLLIAAAGALITASSPTLLPSQLGHNLESEEKISKKLALNRIEAAEAISVSPRTLDDLTKRGLIHPLRATGRPLYSIKELERFLHDTK